MLKSRAIRKPSDNPVRQPEARFARYPPSLTNFGTAHRLGECNSLQEHLMVPARFFLAAAALVATTLRAQEPRTVAAAEPMVSGVIKDIAGLPVSEVEVGIIRGERLQQFVITAADGKFLLTGVSRGMVPLRVRAW